jgi:hypothetical protein
MAVQARFLIAPLMRASLDDKPGWGGSSHQGRKHGLQDEVGASGRTHGKRVFTRHNSDRFKGDLRAADAVTPYPGAADCGCGFQGGQVLCKQPALPASGSNVHHAERLPRGQGKRQ